MRRSKRLKPDRDRQCFLSSQAELDAVLDRNVKLLSVLCSLTYGFIHENRYKTYDEKIITTFFKKMMYIGFGLPNFTYILTKNTN